MNIVSKLKTLSRKKKIVLGILLAVIIGFTAFQLLVPKKTKQTYQTAQVQKSTIISTVTENGNVSSTSQASVSSPTTGIIEEIYVKNGDVVTAGQNLFKVKSTASAQDIASAYASYLNSSASYNTATQNKLSNQAKLEQDRQAVINASTNVTNLQTNLNNSYNNPATKQPYTQNEIDAINSALTSARQTFSADEQKVLQTDTNIAAAAAAKTSAWLSYQSTQTAVVAAPIGGTIANLSVRVGDAVTGTNNSSISSTNSNTSATTASTVLAIGNFSAPYIKVQANENDVPNIKPDQKATITIDAFSGKTYVGKVDQVDTVGTSSSGVVTYNVFVSFVAPPDNLKPGMSASVVIQTGRKDDVLNIPSSAIQTSNGESTVRVLKNNKITSASVETGFVGDTETEIVSGLNENDSIVTGSLSMSTGASGSSSPFGNTLRMGGATSFGGTAGGSAAVRRGGQ
ncbi:HlyD family efflux transporter periplasmic adaptor subunit [Candidatus Roizmanbacteria bacterium]|nr:HlyD family efflux transporter periplasmic adaptor subunit [Candidatus Roizmanbacteria bacterium]